MSRTAASLLALALLALTAMFAAPVADAHALRLAHLELQYDGGADVRLSWRSPEADAAPRVVLGRPCRVVDEMRSEFVSQRLECPAAATASRLQLVGAPAELPVVLVLRRGGETPRVRWLADPDARDWPWFGAAGAWAEATDYLQAGARHVLGGADHLLFLVALFAFCRGARQLAEGTLLFTLGHALSLVAIASGRVSLSPRLAEIGIALTLVVAARAVALRRATAADPGGPERAGSLAATAAAFGVVHGLGFAGALDEVGLQAADSLRAIAAFNVGVELGQVLFVAALAVAGFALRRSAPWNAWPWSRYASLLVGGAGMFWCLERMVAA